MYMKQRCFWGRLLPILTISLLCTGLASCGDDDDDGNAPTKAGVLDKKTGLRLTRCGDYRIYYDDKGRIDYIRENYYNSYYNEWTFSYSPNTITYRDRNDSKAEVLNVGYNSSGYLSSMKLSDSGQDSYESWTVSSSTTLSYDSSGHLTKITGSGKETGEKRGERYSETWDVSCILNWRNGLLMTVTWTETEKEDGETEKDTETYTYHYDNDGYENKYRQWTPSVGYWLELDDIEAQLAYAGMFGIGPDMLPSSVEMDSEEFYDGSWHKNKSRSYSFRHSFNGDGSVSYTTVGGTTYNFSYDYVDTDSKDTRAASSQQGERTTKTLRHLFRK